MDSNKIVIECDCHTHLLVVVSDKQDAGDGKIEHSFDLAMFNYGNHSAKRSFWFRLKACWLYLWSGNMYSDQLILTPEEAKKMADFVYSEMYAGSK